MPNNTVIMVSFAACSALSLSVTPTDSRSSLAPSVRKLIEETADVLERIGVTPSHRNGASVVYGRFLRELVRRGPVTSSLYNHHESGVVASGEVLPPPRSLEEYAPVPSTTQSSFSAPLFWSEPMHFSAMSDGQIIDAVNRAGSAFGTSIPDIPLDDMMGWDWLDLGNAADFTF